MKRPFGLGPTVHLMSWRDVSRELVNMRRQEGRNVRELELYTTDDLRRLTKLRTTTPSASVMVS